MKLYEAILPATEPADVVSGDTGLNQACFNCGRDGHIARHWRKSSWSFDTPTYTRTPDTSSKNADDNVDSNHTTRERSLVLLNNAICVRATISGRSRTCLINTRSEVNMVPSGYVEGLELQPSTSISLAANGAEIRVLGDMVVPLKFFHGFELNTRLLVSDKVFMPMLGME